MHIEQIDRYCDLYEQRLRQGDELSVEQFLQEQQLPHEAQLLAELRKLEGEYRARPAGARGSLLVNNREVSALPVQRPPSVLTANQAMPAAGIHDLESAILRAGILSHEEWNAALSSLPPDTRDAGPETIVQELARGGRITEFQRQMLLAGQAEGLVLGEYTLRDLLGAGGMGRVFRALHRRMGREVALKVLPERVVAQDEAVQRFEREVRVAARLVHPNVVTAYDAGESQGTHYLVMEYVPGADLASVVKSLGPLPVADALRCTIQAAAGLAYAHSQGVTHRDIKPGNLLLNPQGAVKVLDLGLARMRAELPGQSDSLSASGTVMGTVDYMPPEQALNSRLADERSDVYSLGCTLYFLLTGRPVFRGDTVMEKLLAHREAPLPDLRADCPAAPPQLDAVLARMLAKSPADRFASMGEVDSALRECLAATGESADLRVQMASRLGDLSINSAAAESTRNYLVERSMLSTHVARAPTYVPSPSAPPQPALVDIPGRRGRRRWPVLVGGLGLLIALGAAIVLRLPSADGTLVIDVIEPGAQILVDDKQVATVTSADGNHVYRISVDPGRRMVKVRTQNGVEFFSEDVTISAGKETPLLTARIDKGPPRMPPGLDDDVLTVAQDGSAEFTSLQSALDAVKKPGMTIRVVDAREYAESLELQVPRRFSKLTLESTNRATLVPPAGRGAFSVRSVDGVLIRGFRIRIEQPASFGIVVEGNCPGCVVENVEFSGSMFGSRGLGLEALSIPSGADPVTVSNCRFESQYIGLRVSGLMNDYKTPMPCRGALIAGNSFVNSTAGLSMIGAVSDVAVVGNRFVKCTMAGVQFENLVDDAAGNPPQGLFMANNTFLECAGSLKLWDDQVRRDAVTVRSNLVLDPVGVDWAYIDSGDDPSNPRGAGKVQQVIDNWRVGGNWRETSPPLGNTVFEQAWIPPAETDVLRVPIEVPRDPDQPDFLQPAAESELATAGSGEAHGLPPYVGAVPPPGVDEWDWNKTWQKLRDPGADGVLTVAQDGSAEFNSLTAALNAARPGITIRITDAAEYDEPLQLRNPHRYGGITIESPRRARLVASQNSSAIQIQDVDRVTLRGIAVRAAGNPSFGITLAGDCRGCLIEDVHVRGEGRPTIRYGVNLVGLSSPPGAEPVVVRGCRFEALSLGVRVSGIEQDFTTPLACRGLLVADNLFLGNSGGVDLYGAVRDVVVVGNRFVGSGNSGVQFGRLCDDRGGLPPGRVLIANNSFLECAGSLVLWDNDVRGERIALRNNLVLSPVSVDWTFVESDSLTVPKGPGDGKKVLAQWSFSHNWRETLPPQGTSPREQAWIPKAEQDVLQESIAVASRDEKDADFLQPAADSPLATSGAGVAEGLPSYVGAVAPPGAEPWDWKHTWAEWTTVDPAEDGVLTVARDGSAEYTTIVGALERVRPGMTIRVLDAGEYGEPLILANRRRFENITLEAAQRATLVSPRGESAVRIQDVPGVTLRGFAIRAAGTPTWCVMVVGGSPGCQIDDVHFQSILSVTSVVTGVSLEGLSAAEGSPPVVVRRCRFQSLGAGVRVSGIHNDYKSPWPCRGALIVDNLFHSNNQSIRVTGAVRDAVIAGNRFVAARLCGTQLENLLHDEAGNAPGRILIANNTFLDCVGSFRIWDDDIVGELIELRSNLILSPSGPDCLFMDSGDSARQPRGPGDGQKILDRWSVAGNWRETFLPAGNPLIDQSLVPKGPGDMMQDDIVVASRVETDPAFLQPAADSPLATGGSGADAGLPAYVGAVAPPGAPAWDWNVTWQAWLKDEQ